MCGIYAAINGGAVTESLVAGLGALSYRGYDSAGVAVIGERGLERRRAEGKLENLVRLLKEAPLDGGIGIAHTRWATHGKPSKRNAHPHMTARVAVVHNGIIENHAELHAELVQRGYLFESDTDSETIPQLITYYLDQGQDHESALHSALGRLEGSFAVVAVFADRSDDLFAARKDSPLVIGQAGDAYYLSSDANALGPKVDKLCFLEDGDLACVARSGLKITDLKGRPVERCLERIGSRREDDGKQGFPHYMLKEIHQQPEVLERSFDHYFNTMGMPRLPVAVQDFTRLSLVACGTSFYAGMVAKYWLEELAGLPVDVDIASEFRYRKAPIDASAAALFISQSGETADTLAALRHVREAGQRAISLVNVENSSMAFESDVVLPIMAGTEIGVASTKAFTAQLGVMAVMTLAAAYGNGRIDIIEQSRLASELRRLPRLMAKFLGESDDHDRVAARLQHCDHALYLGRGIGYPLALEGALKLKEISYIHAEAYPAGELKHGPIALVDEKMPVIVVMPPDRLLAKSLSNLREVAARGARIMLISNCEGVDRARDFIEDAIVMPDVDPFLHPLLYSLPLQLLAYKTAVLKGTDVDQPRNLAKSVTVE